MYFYSFDLDTVAINSISVKESYESKSVQFIMKDMTGYAGSRDYVGNLHSPWRTSSISV